MTLNHVLLFYLHPNPIFLSETGVHASLFPRCHRQCAPINNTSALPPFEYKVNSKIDNVIFTEFDILSIIRSLNSNKAHGWDDISTRMV